MLSDANGYHGTLTNVSVRGVTAMGIISRAKRVVSGGETDEGEPSHVCQSCGEEYYTDPTTEIVECRACGGVRVDRV